jgi:hypothetical protein
MFGLRNRLQGSKVLLCFAGFVSAAALTFAADVAVDAVLGKLRPQLVADISDLRGVACMESVERTRYAARRPSGNATCGELIAAAGGTPRGAMVWHSRLRLDVTAGAGGENFALTDVRNLERSDVGGVLRAADAGSGEFSAFLRNLINGDGAAFQTRGVQQISSEPLLAFSYTVPEDKSHFLYASTVGPASSAPIRAGYKGSLYMVPQSGDLKRLTMEAEDVGDACRVQYSTDYSPTRVGSRETMLPQSSTMDVLYRNGTELRSETWYSGCRRPATEAAAPPVAADTAKPLPPGVRFRIRFQPPIDTLSAATGDPVVGVIRATVKDKQNGILMHAGDRVHGRIALIEEYMSPAPRWNLSIAMETIERGVGAHGIDQGVEQTVLLAPLDDGDREPHDETMGADEMQKMRPPGGGYFIFHDVNVVLDQRFETEWETR